MLYSNGFDSSGYSAILHVPAGSTELYQNAVDWMYEGWAYFTTIVEFENEDANMDGAINVGDVTSLYSKILSNDNDVIWVCDVDGDGTVTSADITAVYSIILGNSD